MKIYFVDLHCNDFFVITLWKILIKDTKNYAKMQLKHNFLLRYLLKSNVQVYNLVTVEKGTTLRTKFLRQITSSKYMRLLEANFVLRFNGLKNIKSVTDFSTVDMDSCIVSYNYFEDFPTELKQTKAKKYIDFIHFYGMRDNAEKVKEVGFDYYLFDVNLNKYSKLFQKNYSFLSKNYISRGYAFNNRFKIRKKFRDRKNKAVAMGTSTRIRDEEFFETYGAFWYQPARHMIYELAKKYPNEIDSYISEPDADFNNELKKVNSSDSWFITKMKYAYNLLKNRDFQKDYYSFDMVEKYNEYQMFICPEDINGSYGIGVLEGMACGCAMIGRDYGAFEDMGMKSGEHYISYDGTMEHLVSRIKYYQKPENRSELYYIAKTGCRFIRENYNEQVVAKQYIEKLSISKN